MALGLILNPERSHLKILDQYTCKDPISNEGHILRFPVEMNLGGAGCSSTCYAQHAECRQLTGRSAALAGVAVGWQLAPGGRTGAPAASGAVASQGSFASVERDGEDRAEVAATRGPKLDVALRSQPRPWGGKVLSVRTSWGTSGGASVLSGEVAQALAEWASQRTLLSPEVQACVSLGDGQALPTATGQTRRPPATQEQPRRCGRTGPRPPGPPSGWRAGPQVSSPALCPSAAGSASPLSCSSASCPPRRGWPCAHPSVCAPPRLSERLALTTHFTPGRTAGSSGSRESPGLCVSGARP